MVVKMSARRGARSVEWRITACTIRWMPGEAHHLESAERVEWTETRNLATERGRAGGPDHGSHGGGVPGVETPGGRGSDRTKAGEAGVPLLAELGQG